MIKAYCLTEEAILQKKSNLLTTILKEKMMMSKKRNKELQESLIPIQRTFKLLTLKRLTILRTSKSRQRAITQKKKIKRKKKLRRRTSQ